MSFAPGAYTLTSAGAEDVFVLKLNSNGSVIWADGMGSIVQDIGVGVTSDAAGNVYLLSYDQGGSGDFDPGPGAFTFPTFSSYHTVVEKLDSSGHFVWARGTAGWMDFSDPSGIAIDSAKRIYTTGQFSADSDDPADFDPSDLSAFNLTSQQDAPGGGISYDVFLWQLTDWTPGTIVTPTSGLTTSEANGPATFTIALTSRPSSNVIISLSSSDATEGTVWPSSLTFTASNWNQPQTVTVTGVDDAIVDGAQSYSIVTGNAVSSDPNYAGRAISDVAVTNSDNEVSVTISLSGSPMAENGGSATVTANLSGTVAAPVTVNLGFTGTAGSAADYTPSASSIIIPAGQTSGSITLTAINDSLYESAEGVVVDIIAVTNALESGTQQVIGTITDDDPAPAVTLGLTGSPMAENNGLALVTATLSAAAGTPVTVNLAFSGTAARGTDYTLPAASVVIPAGQTTGSITLAAQSDLVSDPDETVVLDISSVINGVESGTQQVTALITDSAPPSLSIDDVAMPEGQSGLTDFIFTVTLAPAATQAVTVQYVTASDSAFSGSDFAVASGTLTFTPGQSTQTITLPVTGDRAVEGDETFFVNLQNATNAALVHAQGLGTIQNDDLAGKVQFSAASYSIGENGGSVTVTITRTDGDAAGAGVWYSTGVGTATPNTATPNLDYTPGSGLVTFDAGETSRTFSINIVNDSLTENDETVALALSNPVGGAGPWRTDDCDPYHHQRRQRRPNRHAQGRVHLDRGRRQALLVHRHVRG